MNLINSLITSAAKAPEKLRPLNIKYNIPSTMKGRSSLCLVFVKKKNKINKRDDAILLTAPNVAPKYANR